MNTYDGRLFMRKSGSVGDSIVSFVSYEELTGSLFGSSISITGSLIVTAGITGSLQGTATSASFVTTAQTASYVLQAVSSSFATTSSFVKNAQTASYILQVVSASYATTASYALNVPVTASFAITASFVTTAQTASYVLNAVSSSFATTASYLVGQSPTASYALTASYADNFTVGNTLTAQRIVVQTISSSIEYASGSNIFGSLQTNTHSFTGSVGITGSLAVAGNILPSADNVYTIGNPSNRFANIYSRGSLYVYGGAIRGQQLVFGDEVGGNYMKIFTSPGNIAISNLTSPTDNGYRLQVNSSSSVSGALWVSGSSVFSGSLSITQGITGSLFGSASNALSSSYAPSSSFASFASTASFVTTAQTASYIVSASNAVSSSYAYSASYAISSSQAVTSSFSLLANTASFIITAQTASYVTTAQTASFVTNAQTASYVLNAVSSSFATTASYLLGQSPTASYALTASYADNFTVGNTLTAQRIVVQTISSSIVYSSGSNRFGNDVTNTQAFTGSVLMTGSLNVAGNITSSGNIQLTTNNATIGGSSGTISFGGNNVNIIGNNAIGFYPAGGISAKMYGEGNLTIANNSGLANVNYGYRLALVSTGSGGAIGNSGSLYVSGLSTFDGIISGSFTSNNPSSSLIVLSGSIQPSASLGGASAMYMNTVLSASANSQTLVGLDINPTFNTGSFTGVSNLGLRVKGDILPSSDNLYNLGSNSFRFAQIYGYQSAFTYYYSPSGLSSYFGTSTNASINFPINNVVYARFHATTGNLTLQNGGTFTDAGYRLDVVGTTRIQDALTLSGSVTGVGNTSNYTVTASSGSAISKKITSTLVAAANSDVLVGLDIAPTFTNGSFTGVTNYGLRVNGNIQLISSFGTTINNYAGNTILQSNSAGVQLSNGVTGSYFRILPYQASFWSLYTFASGNTQINSGPTDLGYKFQVTGTTQFQGTTASDTAPLGSELAGVTGTGTNWALASGATNLNVGGYIHTVGSTTALTTSLAAVNGTYYQITYTITGRTAGSITIAYGGTSTAGITATGNTGPLASSTGVLTITPTTDFDGTIVLSIKSIGTSSASSTFANSSGTSNIEVRASDTSNTFIGFNSGRRNTTGNGNTFIGLSAGQVNTTGVANTYIGAYAGQLNTTGGNNSFLGYNAGNNNTGNNNAFFGAYAGQLNTTGGNNTFIGQSAGQSNTTGGNNTFIGQSAGTANTTANNNTFIGYVAGNNNTTGAENTFIGQNAGGSNTTGSSNVFVGREASLLNTTGGSNVVIGWNAMRFQTTGNNNIGIGTNAGRNISDGSTANAISANSIYIGNNTKALADSQTNQIVIGYASTGLGSNTTVLGNSSTATTAIYGNLLLGTTGSNGSNILQVSGSSLFTGSVNITGSLYSNGPSTFDGVLSGSFAANNPSSSLVIISGSIQPSASLSGSSAMYINTLMSASANNQILVGLDAQTTFNTSSFTNVNVAGLRSNGIILNNAVKDQYYTIRNTSANTGTLSLDIIPNTTTGNYQQTVSIKGQNARLSVENTNDSLVASFVPTYSKFQFQVNSNYVFFVNASGVVASIAPTTSANNTPRNYLDDGNGNSIIAGKLTVVSASIQSQNTSSLASGTQTISTNATSSYTAAFYNYTISSGSNARAGQFIATWNGSSLQYMDNSTLDIGNTSAVALTGSLSGANVLLTSTLPSNGWTIKTLVDLI